MTTMHHNQDFMAQYQVVAITPAQCTQNDFHIVTIRLVVKLIPGTLYVTAVSSHHEAITSTCN